MIWRFHAKTFAWSVVEVMHGSLAAAFLAGMADRHCRGAAISGLEFRALSPLFAEQPFTIAVKKRARELHRWAANDRGE
ncbi:hypothetical protein [Candidatus Spongiihabitans sp.]|uniref:hypothetical protein n=1 Tax=Candidatus Spongiihabitans sp. TaxID=3101308 RepID=UPI003C702D9F